jgi:hypothetical protein
MSKTIIIGDCHNRCSIIDQILELEPDYDKAIFGGDEFDQFYDTPEDARRTAIWLKKSLENKKHVHLLANHNFSYMFSHNREALCSGFTHEKCRAIYSVIDKSVFYAQQSFHVEQGILFTHAGCSKRFLDFMVQIGQTDEFEYNLDNVSKKLEEWTKEAYEEYQVGGTHPLFKAGWERGGDQKVGGIIWIDNSQFVPIDDVPQVYFHTPQKTPNFKFTKKDQKDSHYSCLADSEMISKTAFERAWGLCMDTNNNHYATLNNGHLAIYELTFDKDWRLPDRKIVERTCIFNGKVI